MARELTHFIGGKHVAGTSGNFGDVFDPNTGEIQARVPLADVSEVEAVIADAEQAQREWAKWNPQRRARVLMKFLALVTRDMEELARLLSSEHGKTIADARVTSSVASRSLSSLSASRICSRASTPKVQAAESTSTRCVSRSAS